MEVDGEGTLRLKWWKNNDRLKDHLLETSLIASDNASASSLKMLDMRLKRSQTYVIEGTISGVEPLAAGDGKKGIFLDQGGGQGQGLMFTREAVQFGAMKADGSDFKIQQTSNRDLDLGPFQNFRLVVRGDMMELYVNDYLMNLKRVHWNGQIGLIGAGHEGTFKNIKVWESK